MVTKKHITIPRWVRDAHDDYGGETNVLDTYRNMVSAVLQLRPQPTKEEVDEYVIDAVNDFSWGFFADADFRSYGSDFREDFLRWKYGKKKF